MASVLVNGWYGRGNAGDELMATALRRLFEPRGVVLQFVDDFSVRDVEACDGVIFGGGSILSGFPNMDDGAFELLAGNKRPVFYVGVGMETSVHPSHAVLLDVARAIIARSFEGLKFTEKAVCLPDLVYSLPQVDKSGDGRGLLVIPNMETIPTHEAPHWSHIGWECFKNEFAQFLDGLINDGTSLTFLLMCKNTRQDDQWAAHEIIARMKNRSTRIELVRAHSDALGMTSFISGFGVVITQRYHGIILAQMAGVPHVSIDHHDKLKTAWPRKGVSIPYHGASKMSFVEGFELARKMPREQTRIPTTLYDDLAIAVVNIIDHERRARVQQVRGNT